MGFDALNLEPCWSKTGVGEQIDVLLELIVHGLFMVDMTNICVGVPSRSNLLWCLEASPNVPR